MLPGSTVLLSAGPCNRLSTQILERGLQTSVQIRSAHVVCQRLRPPKRGSVLRLSKKAANEQDIETDGTTTTTTTDFLEGRGRNLASHEVRCDYEWVKSE